MKYGNILTALVANIIVLQIRYGPIEFGDDFFSFIVNLFIFLVHLPFVYLGVTLANESYSKLTKKSEVDEA